MKPHSNGFGNIYTTTNFGEVEEPTRIKKITEAVKKAASFIKTKITK